jgi:O-succinylbenzoic acid--CoA ligase
MGSYSYNSILLNGKEVTIQSILSGTAYPQSDFESHTIEFIRDWLNGVTKFTLRTSGSTGEPKPITITRDQMASSAKATEQALELKPGYRSLICLDTRFIAGKMMIARCLVTDMWMEVQEPRRNPFTDLRDSHQIDFVALVPYQVEEILESPKAKLLNKIRTVIIGGAQLNQSTADKLKAYCCRAYLTYGMTETISHIALNPLTEQTETNVFEALPGIVIGVDSRGCLAIKAPYLTDEVVTNDLVEILSSKKFRWLGRWDNVINSGGFKVNPEKVEFQIEKTLRSLNVDRRFFIAGIKDIKAGEVVALFVEGSPDDGLAIDLQNRLKAQLERHENPRRVIFFSTFRYTATNKLDRKATLQAFLEE